MMERSASQSCNFDSLPPQILTCEWPFPSHRWHFKLSVTQNGSGVIRALTGLGRVHTRDSFSIPSVISHMRAWNLLEYISVYVLIFSQWFNLNTRAVNCTKHIWKICNIVKSVIGFQQGMSICLEFSTSTLNATLFDNRRDKDTSWKWPCQQTWDQNPCAGQKGALLLQGRVSLLFFGSRSSSISSCVLSIIWLQSL